MAVVGNDPFGNEKAAQTVAGNAPSPTEVNNFHSRSDKDSALTSQHHTLGIKKTQASPGNHSHDGGLSLKVGTGMQPRLSVTGAKGGNVALANLLTMLARVMDFDNTTT